MSGSVLLSVVFHLSVRCTYIILEPTARGFQYNIAPTTRRTVRSPIPSPRTLRAETITSFNSASTPSDFSFEEVPSPNQRHRQLSPLLLPRNSSSNLPTPDHSTSSSPDLAELLISFTPLLLLIPLSPDFILTSTPATPTTPDFIPIPEMAHPIPMPMRNERAAPKFDTSKPRELPRFFEDLEQLLDRAQITDEDDMKKQVVRYADFETEQIWKSFPEFKTISTTYQTFKKAILSYYPDASGDFVYSIRDMDSLIGE